MAENIVTNANDVELVMSSSNATRGTAQSNGRVIVDEFSISREEDDSLVSGVGFQLPGGITNGDITHNFSFTISGQDVAVFEMIASKDGKSQVFSFTARKQEDDVIEWEYALDTCKATSEELSASSGDVMEYSVEGIAVSVDKVGTKADGGAAWSN